MRPGNAARTNTPTASSGSIFQKEPTCRVTRKPTSIKLPIFSTRVHARNSASVLRKRFISLLCSPILPLKVLHFRVETAQCQSSPKTQRSHDAYRQRQPSAERCRVPYAPDVWGSSIRGRSEPRFDPAGEASELAGRGL